MSLEKVVYTAHAKATGGRDGRATSSDGILDIHRQDADSLFSTK